jgi:transcriptional regulator with XRE-family HTH domain
MRPVPKDTVSPFLRKVGARVKHLREAREWSQAELARKTKIHRVYLSGIERGIRNFTILHLQKLARAFEVTPGSILDE